MKVCRLINFNKNTSEFLNLSPCRLISIYPIKSWPLIYPYLKKTLYGIFYGKKYSPFRSCTPKWKFLLLVAIAALTLAALTSHSSHGSAVIHRTISGSRNPHDPSIRSHSFFNSFKVMHKTLGTKPSLSTFFFKPSSSSSPQTRQKEKKKKCTERFLPACVALILASPAWFYSISMAYSSEVNFKPARLRKLLNFVKADKSKHFVQFLSTPPKTRGAKLHRQLLPVGGVRHAPPPLFENKKTSEMNKILKI